MARMLVVEDDEQVRMLVEDFLRHAGFEVYSASTFADGRELLRHGAYDLLLTDGRLPDGTGFGLAHQAHEKGIRVLVWTGYAHQFSQEDRQHFTVLSKPLRMGELLSHIETKLGESA